MTNGVDGSSARSNWFVGAMYNQTEDQSPRFLEQGIWVNGYEDKYLDLVRSMRSGDRIAIKAAYTRRHDLPFDNRGQAVSAMAIKAVGTVTKNHGDGRTVEVDWSPSFEMREWYFYTYRGTIWRVVPDKWESQALVAFAFDGEPQDYDRFRNAPYWRDRYGDTPQAELRFQWTKFYESIADGLLAYKEDRAELVESIHRIASDVGGLSHLQDQFRTGESGPLRDICPFTVMGIFNRGITDSNRRVIARALADILGVEEPVPDTFEGIPVLNNQASWFFTYEKDRQPDDIDTLWAVFEAGIRFQGSDAPEARADFVAAFDDATARVFTKWNLTFGLYWIRPWQFISLDTKSRQYLHDHLNVAIGRGGNKGMCSGEEYLELIDSMAERFGEDAYPVHSFPELSLAAWQYEPAEPEQEGGEEDETDTEAVTGVGESITPYSVQDIVEEGCFVAKEELETIIDRLRQKKNLILQGPPGTGKSWLAKKLAYALMGRRDEGRVRAVQFHPNLSYEDFVRGWRPCGEGRLDLVDGPLLQMIKTAKDQPGVKFVLVIEEINRGNPAQIFGEMLTLLEADKRTPAEAIELCYRRDRAERVHIPSNLYVIGTMNIADRSLALVDLALRRRFAFVDLEPRVGDVWRDWVTSRFGVDVAFLDDVQRRIGALNEQIAADPSLGKQFRIGHSYVTPYGNAPIADPRRWFDQIVRTEIGPLLEEYWFDSVTKAHEARDRLLEGV